MAGHVLRRSKSETSWIQSQYFKIIFIVIDILNLRSMWISNSYETVTIHLCLPCILDMRILFQKGIAPLILMMYSEFLK